ncbi:VOC family protein [Paenibacillus sp. N3/727]|uniref:VOC family protein n=1 Tax=Paenibacillus sp. N3/727 TaxID=2925845 RepID=UPI001F53B033|nr:VOC family protein [Paenibacillus sp. N3/727]UNK17481.1 VOC family protein [Paenibacillus sp. N3/727]
MQSICVISINVTDMKEAIFFYCDILGFEISKVYDDECIVGLKHEAVPVILNKVDNVTAVDYPREAQVVLGIQTQDLKASIADFQAKGIEVIFDTPQFCPPGTYSAIKDPFGNVIELLEFQET